MQFRSNFLSAIGAADMAELSPYLKEVALFGGETLCHPGEPVRTVYFPSSSAICVATVMADGRDAETASIGYEGVAGLLPALTRIAPTTRMFVQIGGGAISLPGERLRTQAFQSSALMALILQFAQSRSAHSEQAAACYALHPLAARLARWLLLCEDRVDRREMMLTQDDMALIAGALRSSISVIASEFKSQGLIRYSRGHVEIIDRPRLERRACECYDVDRARRACPAA
jgi:CRP-like cAMP-binding protein